MTTNHLTRTIENEGNCTIFYTMEYMKKFGNLLFYYGDSRILKTTIPS